MKFNKTLEIIKRAGDGYGYLLIRKLEANEQLQSFSDSQIITDIILSNYHHWRGEEEPNGLNIDMSSTDKYGKTKSWTLTNHKFYGFFNHSKIKANNYKQIKFDDFYNSLTNTIEKETKNNNDFVKSSKLIIDKNLRKTSTYYVLDLDQEKNKDLLAEWQVYTFFYAFLSIDKEDNYVYLVEFGLD